MDWATVQSSIKAALLVALGDENFDADWDTADRVRDDACAYIQWVSLRPAGRPEQRRAYDSDSDQLLTTVRQDMTLSVDVRFETASGLLEESALALAHRAAVALFADEALAELPAGLALIVADVVPIRNFPSDGRIKSGATLTLRFRCGSEFTALPADFVEQVFAEGSVVE